MVDDPSRIINNIDNIQVIKKKRKKKGENMENEKKMKAAPVPSIFPFNPMVPQVPYSTFSTYYGGGYPMMIPQQQASAGYFPMAPPFALYPPFFQQPPAQQRKLQSEYCCWKYKAYITNPKRIGRPPHCNRTCTDPTNLRVD